MSGYTREEYVFQNYIEGENYWESPTMLKNMAYLDFGGALQYDCILKKKIQMGISSGGGTSYLVEGKDVLTFNPGLGNHRNMALSLISNHSYK